ncbi:MAG: hypothetical protein Q4E02_00445, partial [Lagierella massiliensis]|nr:hypothetical protein [Lagierella massiliensis]
DATAGIQKDTVVTASATKMDPSIKVETFVQGKNEKQGEEIVPTINIKVPGTETNKPALNTNYVVEKFDPINNTWVQVGQIVVTDPIPGQTVTIPLTENTTEDGDKVRVVAKEPGKIPTSSTSTNELPEDGEGVVTLDRKAPTATIEAKDEKFRRFIDITGQLDELPEGNIILEIDRSGKGKGDPGNEKIEFSSKEKVIEYINTIPRLDNMPKMWLYAKDEFDNQSETEIQYERTYQNKVSVLDYRMRRKALNVTSDVAGITVTATVYNKENVEVASGNALIQVAGKYEKLNLFISGTTDQAYRLKKNDRIRITSKGTVDGRDYYSNPFDIVVK